MGFRVGFLFLIVGVMAQGAERAVIFDIDDTLVYNRPRTTQILQEIGRELKLPELVALEVSKVDFFCDVTLKNVGLTEAALLERICGHTQPGKNQNTLQTGLWGKVFFTQSSYLHYDQVMPGAAQFVAKAAKTLGAHVIYLTGRSDDKLRKGTEEQLAYFNFPGYGTRRDKTKTTLLLKPDSYKGEDVTFKKDTLAALRRKYAILAVFDDSKTNSNMFRQELPLAVPVVRPITNIKDTAGMEPGIEAITNYYYNAQEESGARKLVVNDLQLDAILKRAAASETVSVQRKAE